MARLPRRQERGCEVIMINTTAARLAKGQRLKLRHMKQLWTCIEPASESNDGCACIELQGRRQWISSDWEVQIPLENKNLSERIRPNSESSPWVCEEIKAIERENAAMREAIREVAHAMDNLIIAKRGGMQPANALIEAMTYAKAALSKLQPFLKP